MGVVEHSRILEASSGNSSRSMSKIATQVCQGDLQANELSLQM